MNIRETRNRYLTILFKVMTSANTRTKSSPATSGICQQRVLFWVTVYPPERYVDILTPGICEYDLIWK